MNIITRHILRSIIPPFVFGTGTVTMLFFLQYIIKYLNDFAGKGLGPMVIMEFIVLSLSWIIVLAIPIGILFGTLMAFGSMSAAHEITIFKTSGMGLFRMMAPVLVIGAILWGFVFWYMDAVVPDTNVRLSTLLRDVQRVKPAFAVQPGQFARAVEGYNILARSVDSSGTMYGVTIYDYSTPGQFNMVNADTGKLSFSPSFSKLIVTLSSGEIHQMNTRNPNDYRVVAFDKHRMLMTAERFFFESSEGASDHRSDRELSIADMEVLVAASRERIARADSAFSSIVAGTLNTPGGSAVGADIMEARAMALRSFSFARAAAESEAQRRLSDKTDMDSYLVEIHKKYAIPAACIIFVFVGCPMGIITRGGSLGMSASVCLAFYIVYWASLIGGEKLADRGEMDPMLAMWMGNILIFLIGLLVTVRVNYEVTFSDFIRKVVPRIGVKTVAPVFISFVVLPGVVCSQPCSELPWESRQVASINPASVDAAAFPQSVSGSVLPLVIAVPALFAIEGYRSCNPRLVETAAAIAISGIAAYGIVTSTKAIVNRPRPYQEYAECIKGYGPESDPAFPSGHTAGMAVLATVVTLRHPSWYVALPSFAAVAAIGWSRMALGMHYLTDVIAGAAVGVLSGFAVNAVLPEILPAISFLIPPERYSQGLIRPSHQPLLYITMGL